MSITARQFLVVKDGSPVEHNDDAAAFDPVRRRFAISDGATESGFSRIWSRLLVDQFVQHSQGPVNDWSSWLPAAQAAWLDQLQGVKIPWYGEEQFQQGSFATFLGVVLGEPQDSVRSWQAVAVGDSCLFLTRDYDLLTTFPLEKSSEFDSRPRLVGSRSPITEIAAERSLSTVGFGQAGDRLWLTTDAFAKWCLSEIEADRSPWWELDEFLDPENPTSHHEKFVTWINSLRSSRGLHNDDVTVMAIDL